MSGNNFSLRTRKFMTNRLLNRKQMILDVFHPERASVSKAELVESIADRFRVSNPQTIVVFGFKIQFGGGKSTGFALIYDTIEDRALVEPKFRQIRCHQNGFGEKVETSRKQIKELKNRKNKVRGKKKATVGGGKK